MIKNIALGLAVVIIGGQTWLLSTAHSANAARLDAEHKHFACLDGDRLSTNGKFTECKRVIWRLDTEDLGN